MSTRKPSRVVFVGNIPYGLSEEQITDIFSSAGTVERFRLVYDSETGRPRGYGFADYPDTDSAASAVRNLNDHEIMGRKLKVDFSDQKSAAEEEEAARAGNGGSNGASYAPQSSSLQLPPGKDIPPGLTCTDSISRTLNTLPPSQLLDILGQMKILASSEPQRATELLQQAPQLSYAVFQALLLMGLVSPEAIQSVVDPSGQASQPPTANYGGLPQGYGQAPATNTPPVPPQGYAPPPAAAPPVGGQDQEALIRAVMELPQAQIDLLPEAEKQQVMALRAAYGGQRR